MLNRRILRIKAFKVIYSFAENPVMTLQEAKDSLRDSCEASRDLYLLVLMLAGELAREDRERLEAASRKFSATSEEKHPSFKFADNAIAGMVTGGDPDFVKVVQRKKLSWENCDVFVRNLYNTVREQEWFKAYMSSGKTSLAEDASLMIRIFSDLLPDNGELYTILEEKSLYWLDDLDYVLNIVGDSLSRIGRGQPWRLPELYLSDMKRQARQESDHDFVFKLVEKAYSGYGRYYRMVAESVPKWDKDRLFTTDLAIMACALAEIEFFPDIPAKVSLNEYVEISKFYGTPKSRQFVNGLLDKLVKNNFANSL